MRLLFPSKWVNRPKDPSYSMPGLGPKQRYDFAEVLMMALDLLRGKNSAWHTVSAPNGRPRP